MNTSVLRGKSKAMPKNAFLRRRKKMFMFRGELRLCDRVMTRCFSTHYVGQKEKQHSGSKNIWCFSPLERPNHSLVNMLPSCVHLFENTGAVSIPVFPSPLSLLALPGGHQGPWGRAPLTCCNRPCSAATPGALLISTFQFLAFREASQGGYQGQRQVGQTSWASSQREGWEYA